MKNQFPSQRIDGDALMISVGRCLDSSNAYILLEQLEQALDNDHKCIYLDMKECELLSSSGVGSIISNVEAAQAIGAKIILVHPTDAVMEIIDALGLNDVLTIQERMPELQKEAAQ